MELLDYPRNQCAVRRLMDGSREEIEDVSNFSFHLTYSRIYYRYPPAEYLNKYNQTASLLNMQFSDFHNRRSFHFVCNVRIFSLSTPRILRISRYFLGLQMPFWPPLIRLNAVPMGSTHHIVCLGKISEKVILGFVKIFRLSKNTSGVQTLYFGLFDRLALETSWNCLIYNINSLIYKIAQDVLIVYRTVFLVVQLCYFDSIIELAKLTTFYTLSIYNARMTRFS